MYPGAGAAETPRSASNGW